MIDARALGWIRGAAFLVGIAAAASAILGWTVPRGDGTLKADLVVTALQTGELEVDPISPFLSDSSVAPGAPAGGTFDVYNETAVTLSVGIHAEPATRDLDALLMVQVDAGSRRLYRGTLGGLRGGTRSTFDLRSTRTTTISFRAWFAPEVHSGYQGRIDQINLVFDAAGAGS
jgi:hypothetical protein